ncbi:MAG TPA: helix-turn-helix domain-containing protein, partial [Anaerolineales bacterium]|nr:helix-turn-helix domain-containing protein [Anaerolineales bacterium]
GTLRLTLELQQRGLSPAQIAAERGLAEGTIYTHLAELIAEGKVALGAVVDPAVQTQVEEAIRLEGSLQYLSPLKARLPQAISYGEIRCVVEAVRRRA